jgi:hypothetical protein
MKALKFFMVAVATLVVAQSAMADAVVLLGRTKLSNHTDTDFVPVYSCSQDRIGVSAIQLRVRRDGANIDQVHVQFGNGQVQQLHVRQYFTRDSVSRWIPLAGGVRCIRGLRIVGDSDGPRLAKSIVEVWGVATR